MQQYLQLLKDIKQHGTIKPPARANMPASISLFGYQFRHDLSKGFPLLTTKKMFFKGVIIELLWFLKGDTNIKYLIDNGVNIWNQDAYQYYIKIVNKLKLVGNPYTYEQFIEAVQEQGPVPLISTSDDQYKLGDCGYQYGRTWRNFEGVDWQSENIYSIIHIDQIVNLINSLKDTPESRRHIVTAIDPAHDNNLALYWCHCMFQFNCRPLNTDQRMEYARLNGIQNYQEFNNEEEILQSLNDSNIPKYYLDCQLYQRSADVVLGVPFNIASYALLTMLFARICGMIPGEFIHTFGDVHIYENHLQAVEEQLKRKPRDLPIVHVLENHKDHGTLPDHFEKYLVGRITLNDFLKSLDRFDFRIENYNPYDKIEAKLSTGLK